MDEDFYEEPIEPTDSDKLKMEALKNTSSYWDYVNGDIVVVAPDTREELEQLIDLTYANDFKADLYRQLKEVADDKWFYVNYLALGSKPWLKDMDSVDVQKSINRNLYLAAKQKLEKDPTDTASIKIVKTFEGVVDYLSEATQLIEEIKKLVEYKIESGAFESARKIMKVAAEVKLDVDSVTPETMSAIKQQLLSL